MHMAAPDRLEQTLAVIAELLEGEAAAGVTDPRAAQPALWGGEAAHVAGAVPARRATFAAGRAAARAALRTLGHPEAEIAMGRDRSPVWPRGLCGSIAHTSTLCAAVVSDRPLMLGIDLEEDTDLNPELLATICSRDEIARIEGPQMLRLAKLIFCAKEAAYKAQFPRSKEIFGFDHMEVRLDPSSGRFTARFAKPVGPFAVGDVLPGRFATVTGHLVTVVLAGQADREGA